MWDLASPDADPEAALEAAGRQRLVWRALQFARAPEPRGDPAEGNPGAVAAGSGRGPAGAGRHGEVAVEPGEARAGRAGPRRAGRIMKTDLDAGGHEALAQAILARTSGSGLRGRPASGCATSWTDALAPFDRDLIDGHLAHCPACTALAARRWPKPPACCLRSSASRRGTSVVATCWRRRAAGRSQPASRRAPARPGWPAWPAAALQPGSRLRPDGAAARRPGQPGGRVQGDARCASSRSVTAVASAVSRPLAQARAAGEETLTSVERAIRPKTEAVGALAQGRTFLWEFWQIVRGRADAGGCASVREWADSALRELNDDEPARIGGRRTSGEARRVESRPGSGDDICRTKPTP